MSFSIIKRVKCPTYDKRGIDSFIRELREADIGKRELFELSMNDNIPHFIDKVYHIYTLNMCRFCCKYTFIPINHRVCETDSLRIQLITNGLVPVSGPVDMNEMEMRRKRLLKNWIEKLVEASDPRYYSDSEFVIEDEFIEDSE